MSVTVHVWFGVTLFVSSYPIIHTGYPFINYEVISCFLGIF